MSEGEAIHIHEQTAIPGLGSHGTTGPYHHNLPPPHLTLGTSHGPSPIHNSMLADNEGSGMTTVPWITFIKAHLIVNLCCLVPSRLATGPQFE